MSIRRHITRVALCFLGGVVLSVAVAVLAARGVPRAGSSYTFGELTDRDVNRWRSEPALTSLEPDYRAVRYTPFLDDVMIRGGTNVRFEAADGVYRLSWDGRSPANAGGPPPPLLRYVEAGWPARSMRGSAVVHGVQPAVSAAGGQMTLSGKASMGSTVTMNGGGGNVLIAGTIESSAPFSVAGNSIAATRRITPVEPIFSGMLINTGVYGGFLWLLGMSLPGLRGLARQRRRRRGLCPMCGYDLRGRTTTPTQDGSAKSTLRTGVSGCPECGWNRP